MSRTYVNARVFTGTKQDLLQRAEESDGSIGFELKVVPK